MLRKTLLTLALCLLSLTASADSIVGALPYNLTNGTTANATQVMANFNTIVNGANLNAAANGVNSSITQLTGLTTPLTVGQGGTGQNTLAAHGVVIGNAASGVNVTGTGTAAQVLTSNGASSDPTFQTINSFPVGGMVIWTTTSCPAGFLYENGQAVSRSTYATLFGVIGTTFGTGDGTTTFNLPDMRGYFPRGWADDGSIDSGRSFATTQTDAIKSHTVTSTSVVTDPGHTHGLVAFHGNAAGAGLYSQQASVSSSPNAAQPTDSATTGITVATTSSYSGSTETRPYNLALVFCIKN